MVEKQQKIGKTHSKKEFNQYLGYVEYYGNKTLRVLPAQA